MTGTTEPAATAITTNHDLRPTNPAERTSTAWDMASLWVGLIVGVPNYYIAGALVEKGMSWWQAIIVVVSAKIILLFPLLLAGHPGTRYGISFPVFARAAFGVRGAHIPALLRALIACGWFGIETWIGGQALFILLPSSLRSYASPPIAWLGTSAIELACFAVFCLAQLATVWKGMHGIRAMESYSAPILVLLASLLLGWAYVSAGGFGPMLSLPPRLSPSQFWALFFPSLTANVGSWATMALSIPDFTRYTRSQVDQVLGQLGLPVIMGAFSFVGIAISSATQLIFGRLISNPIELLGEIANANGTLVVLLAMPGITLAILTTNIPANIVAPANTLVCLSPKHFTFQRGALLTALIGIAFQPWRIFSSSDSFVYTWLVGYAAIMGPLGGIILTDYYVIRRTVLEVDELYSDSPSGAYYYASGYNMVAIVTLVVSLAPIVPGFLHKVGVLERVPGAFVVIYNISWFFGFFSGALVYGLLSYCCRRWGRRGEHTDAAQQASLRSPFLVISGE